MDMFGFNEDNYVFDYNEENNDEGNNDKEIQEKDILANSTSTNYSSVNVENSIYNNSKNSEIDNSYLKLSNNNIEQEQNEEKNKIKKKKKKKKEKQKSELTKEKINNNIYLEKTEKIENTNIKNNIENNSYTNILNLVIDKNRNKINNSIIISENNSFIDNIINSAINFEISKNKKICFLTPDTKSAQDIYNKFKDNANIKAILLQKGKNKKNKNDYQSFLEQLNQNNFFIILPNILYKLLSIGFTKLSDFGLIIFDECHLCDSNYPYNIIMQEFYFYYFKYPSNVVNSSTLPNILGITQSPFKDKANIKNEKKGLEILQNLSENLDCQIAVDPSVLNIDNKLKEENYDIITVKSIFEQRNKIDAINILLMKYFFEPMLDFCLDDYLKSNGDKKELNQFNLKEINNKYLSVIKEKFSKEMFEEYNKIETSERTIHFLSQNSAMFKTFEDIQKMLINIIQNGDIIEFYYLFDKYKELYENNLKNLRKSNNANEYLQKLYKKLILLFTINKKVFENLKNKNKEYKTDRLTKFINKLKEIFSYNKNPKILICVNNRKMVHILYNYLNRDSPENFYFKNKVHFLVGSNNKKEDNINLILSTRITTNEINERIKDYNEDKINILICTTSALEYITKEKCDHILLFSEMTNTKNDFEKIKEKAKNSNSKLHIFIHESNINKINIMPEDALTTENNENEFIQLKKYFLEKERNIKNLYDYRSKNYKEKKNLEKNFYYYIGSTEAKMSLKNCMLLFNEISNLYISKNIKIDIKKKMDQISKEPKFICQCDFQWSIYRAKFTSNECNDKQSAENECFMKYIIYLHKSELIDDHFRIKL